MVEVSTCGETFASGSSAKDIGAISIAEHVHRAADRYNIYIALHTDHCQAQMLDSFLISDEESLRAIDAMTLDHG